MRDSVSYIREDLEGGILYHFELQVGKSWVMGNGVMWSPSQRVLGGQSYLWMAERLPEVVVQWGQGNLPTGCHYLLIRYLKR